MSGSRRRETTAISVGERVERVEKTTAKSDST